MATSEISAPKSLTLSSNSNSNSNSSNKSSCNPLPSSPRVHDASAILAYEHYLRLSDLSKLRSCNNFPDWSNASILKPALQALEITFRLVSISLSDPRPYSNGRQWKRRLESLANRQIELISILLCEDDPGTVPIADLTAANEVLSRGKSSQEVWKLNGTTTHVSHTSEASLLPRLASWGKSEDVASEILMQVECQMRRCPFTLGLGEPNLAGKPSLEYDLIVRPAELHALKKSPPLDHQLKNQEDQTIFTIHHILESWLCTAKEVLARISRRIVAAEFDEAASDCWLLERIWELLSEVEGLHLLMDPDDFLRLRSQLAIRANTAGSEAFCFWSRALLEVTNLSKDLRHKVPRILGVEVDPNGGPRVQEAAMGLFHSGRRGEGDESGRLHLLQAFQAVEVAVKKFFFGYRQLITAVMGSLEANGNIGLGFSSVEPSDSLTQMFMDPPYFPSLDAAKTFLGGAWQCESRSCGGLNKGNCGMKQQ